MLKLIVTITIVLPGLFFINVPAVEGGFQSRLLNDVASNIAKRPVKVKCKTVEEDNKLYSAWGYVFLPTGKQNYTTVVNTVCVGALAIDKDDAEAEEYYKVMGIAVLTHEAFHLKRVHYNQNEAITECRAMRNYDFVLRMLGAEEETIKRLMPLLIINHYIFVNDNYEYYLESCSYPLRYEQYGIYN